MSKAVSIIIPTFNERENILLLVKRISTALPGSEILFVDDNSTDGTAEAIRALAETYPVTVLVRRNKRGLASAIVDGLSQVKRDIVGVMDADLQHPPEVLPLLFREIQGGADIAVASRYVRGGGCQAWGFSRKMISRGATALAHLLLPRTRRVKDPMSGFFMFRRAIIKRPLYPTGYKILLEVLMEGEYRKTAEIPFVCLARSKGASKLNARQLVEYLKHLWSLMKRQGEVRRFFRFAVIGATGIIVNEGLLWGLISLLGLDYYYIWAVFSIEAAIVSNFILNDRFTFADRRSGRAKSFFWRLTKFNLTCLAGAGIQYGLLIFFTSIAGIHYLLSNLVGIGMAFLWNYLVSTSWTWE